MSVILLDIDGVVASFTDLALRCVKLVSGRTHVEDDLVEYDTCAALGIEAQRDWYDELIRSEGACRSMPPYPGAVDGVRALASWGHIIIPCTTPYKKSKFWHHERLEWIEAHLGAEIAARTVFTSEKFRSRGDYLIDDKPSNLVDWQAVNPFGNTIQFLRPWNSGDVGGRVVTSSWDDLLTLISELELERGPDRFRERR